MSEFLDEWEQQANLAAKQPAIPSFPNAIETHRWYAEQFSNAEEELSCLRDEPPSLRKTLIWRQLNNMWQEEISNLKKQLAKEILKHEKVLMSNVLGLENILRAKTEEWKYSPKNWEELSYWRRELEALQGCEEMVHKAVVETPEFFEFTR